MGETWLLSIVPSVTQVVTISYIFIVTIVKAKIIQALIQIERPMNWDRERLLDTIKDLINVERYNAVVSKTINKFKVKWTLFENIL